MNYIDTISKYNGKFYKNTTEITEQEYNTILEVIKNKPQSEKGFDYRLKEDLTWELYERPTPPPPPHDPETQEIANVVEDAYTLGTEVIGG